MTAALHWAFGVYALVLLGIVMLIVVAAIRRVRRSLPLEPRLPRIVHHVCGVENCQHVSLTRQGRIEHIQEVHE